MSSNEQREQQKRAVGRLACALTDICCDYSLDFFCFFRIIIIIIAMDASTATTAAKEGKEEEEDLYIRYKTLQRELEFIHIQEDYVRDEQKKLENRTDARARGSETNSIGSTRNRTVFRDGG